MAKQVVTRRSTKEDVLIDVAQVSEKTTHWFEVYKKPLLYAGIGLLAIIVGTVAWNYVQAGNQKKAIAAMWRAERMFEQDSFNLALTNPGGGYDGFLDIARKYGSTTTGNLAHYYAGVCYLQTGKFDEAIQELEKYSPKGDLLGASKAGALGDAYSEKKDFAKAMKFYKEAGSVGVSDDIKSLYLKRYGMLCQIQNKNAEALEAFKEIKDKYPLTLEGREIEKYIAAVEMKK